MPNQGVPVIFKNKIAYGYAEKSVQAYDVSVSDYNALTEQQQLDGSIRFIQGVDAIPNGSNVWAKLGTTPLAEGLPRDCSQAVNQLKSNLIDYVDVTVTTTSNADVAPFGCFGETTLDNSIDITKVVGATIYDASLSYKNPAQVYVYTTSRRIRVYTKTAVTLTVRVLVKS